MEHSRSKRRGGSIAQDQNAERMNQEKKALYFRGCPFNKKSPIKSRFKSDKTETTPSVLVFFLQQI